MKNVVFVASGVRVGKILTDPDHYRISTAAAKNSVNQTQITHFCQLTSSKSDAHFSYYCTVVDSLDCLVACMCEEAKVMLLQHDATLKLMFHLRFAALIDLLSSSCKFLVPLSPGPPTKQRVFGDCDKLCQAYMFLTVSA